MATDQDRYREAVKPLAEFWALCEKEPEKQIKAKDLLPLLQALAAMEKVTGRMFHQ